MTKRKKTEDQELKKEIKGREEIELDVRRFSLDNGEVKRRIKC